MPDGAQDFVIKTDSGNFRIRAPEGMDQEQALSLAAATNPQFAEIYPHVQARTKLAEGVGKRIERAPSVAPQDIIPSMGGGAAPGQAGTRMMTPRESASDPETQRARASGATTAMTLSSLPLMVANPTAAVGSLAGGTIGAFGGKMGAEAMNLTPEEQDTAEGLGGLVGSFIGGGTGAKVSGRIFPFVASKMRYPATARQSQLGRAGTIKWSLPFMHGLTDLVIPEGELGSPTRPGPFTEIPARMPKPPKMITTPDPLDVAVREGRAARIPTRMPKMKAPQSVEAAPFEGMTSSAKFVGGAELPRAGARMRSPEVKMVERFEKPTAEKSRIIQPGSSEAKAPRVEGSYWSFKEPALRKAVMSGDRDAAIVYKRRFGELPEGAGFLTDVGQGQTKGLYQSRR